VAKLLGAQRVLAAGRDPGRLALLPALGADEVFALDDEALPKAAADVDVVVDYLWGPPTERLMPAPLTARADRGRPLAWTEIGSVAGPDVTLPSYLLRADDPVACSPATRLFGSETTAAQWPGQGTNPKNSATPWPDFSDIS
jgi:hypothetical protein